MKRTLSAILVIVIVAASLSFAVSAEDEFVITDGVLEKYNGIAAEVVIPDGVVSLGDLAFDGNPTVEKIYVSDTVETIGYADSYADQFDDPIAHFRSYVNQLNRENVTQLEHRYVIVPCRLQIFNLFRLQTGILIRGKALRDLSPSALRQNPLLAVPTGNSVHDSTSLISSALIPIGRSIPFH